MKANKLAIFDLDGTLFDTKDVNFHAYSQAIEKCGFNIEIDYKFYCDFCNGNNYKTFLPKLIKNISNEDMERIHKEKLSLYESCLKYAEKNEHLFEIIECIRQKYKTALVTTASKKNTLEILSAFEKDKTFDFILSKEDVTKTKPDPECFIKAMDIAQCSAENTLIFEDSETGLKAAEFSGAKYVKVYGYN